MKTITTVILTMLSVWLPFQDPVNPGRKAMLQEAFALVEENIANPYWLEEESYIRFKEKMLSDEALSLEEEEFRALFNQERHSLAFTHFQIAPTKKTKTPEPATHEEERKITWKEINPQTAYLKASSFVVPGEQMYEAVSEIGTDRYEYLIVDLRDNTGGTLEGPVVLGQFLTNQNIDAGLHLTRQWYQTHDRPATIEEIQQMPFLKDFTYEGISKMFRENAGFRMVIPGHDRPVFQGKVFVLMNHNTASAGEPLLDLFKKHNVATLVGTRSNGAMLSAQWFNLNDDYKVYLPIADYQTADGSRIDKVGVTPDVEVPSEEALDYVLENLIGQ